MLKITLATSIINSCFLLNLLLGVEEPKEQLENLGVGRCGGV